MPVCLRFRTRSPFAFVVTRAAQNPRATPRRLRASIALLRWVVVAKKLTSFMNSSRWRTCGREHAIRCWVALRWNAIVKERKDVFNAAASKVHTGRCQPRNWKQRGCKSQEKVGEEWNSWFPGVSGGHGGKCSFDTCSLKCSREKSWKWWGYEASHALQSSVPDTSILTQCTHNRSTIYMYQPV